MPSNVEEWKEPSVTDIQTESENLGSLSRVELTIEYSSEETTRPEAIVTYTVDDWEATLADFTGEEDLQYLLRAVAYADDHVTEVPGVDAVTGLTELFEDARNIVEAQLQD